MRRRSTGRVSSYVLLLLFLRIILHLFSPLVLFFSLDFILIERQKLNICNF